VVVDGFPSICPFYPSTSPIYSTNRSTCCIWKCSEIAWPT
jgi:hypothetical protein